MAKPDQMTRTREMPALQVRASVVPGSLDEEARTVELVWTTGARVLRGVWERFWEELSISPKHVRMDRLKSGTAPLLDSHNGFDLRGVLGVVEKGWLKSKEKEGGARVRFATAAVNPRAEEVFQGVKEGVIRNVSVGYRIHKMEKIADGEDKVPVFRAIDWEPYEISMVPMGADAGAGVRAESAETNPCEFVELAHEERGMHENDAQVAPPSAGQETRTVDENAVRQEAMAAERKRSADIRSAARALGVSDEFTEKHIADGTGVDKFRALAIDEYAKEPPIVGDAGRVHAVPGGDERDKFMRGAEHWLIIRSAMGDTIVQAHKKRGETLRLDPGEFRGMSLVELARHSLERQGIRTGGMSKVELVGKALTERSGGYATTSDFPVLLENVLRKSLLAAYAIAPDTWSLFCAVGSVSDFRAHNRYRQGTFGRLETVNEHAEYRNKDIPDGEKQTISATTKGNIIAITRQAIINDDMGAFTSLASRLGRAARLSIEMDVYDLLKANSGLGPTMGDGNPLFDAAHSNISTGAALGVSGIDADRVVMASQTDVSGNEILDLRPAILVVPIGLGGDARVLNEAQYDVSVSNKFQVPNKVRGLFSTIVDTARLTGTRRYLFADPSVAPTIEVAFLDSQQEPYMEMKEGWRVDGAEWKVRLDYGVAAVDYRGAVTNAGA